MQRTTLGVFWALAGALGIFLSRQRQRSILPALILIVTGWVVGTHEQSMPYSTLVHTVFGYTLMAAGVSKLADICLLVDSGPWQHTTPFLLTVAGVMFLSSTDQQLRKVLVKQIDHPTYALIQISTATAIYLFVNMLLSLYERLVVVEEPLTEEYECLVTSSLSDPIHEEMKSSRNEVAWSPQ